MGCCGRRKDDDLRLTAEQRWDYINLNDFKSTSCWTPFSYFLLFLAGLKSVAVYSVDTFTAINLLAFSRWPSQVTPEIPFKISDWIGIVKWIFAGCIILSFVLLIWRWLRAVRVMKSGGIAQCYLDPIAVRIQSFRMGQGQGWRRFLVFAELTKSKKGADYVALFTYFNFEAWLRVIFAEGPRQAINGITLYSIMQLNLIPEGEHKAPKGTSDVQQFFINIEALADKDTMQAVLLFAMLFTFVIWAVTFLCLLISVVLYLLFLWHHVPTEDGSLSTYCRRKINTRLERIVKKKVNKALAQGITLQDRKRTDLETGTTSSGTLKSQPTLPTFDYVNSAPTPKVPDLSRQPTLATLPPYSRPATSNTDHQFGYERQPKLPNMGDWGDNDLPMAGGSGHHYAASDDKSPLVDNAGDVGFSPPMNHPTPPPALPHIERQGTPLSLMTGPMAASAQGRRSPGPNAIEAVGNPYVLPPPAAASGRQSPGNPLGSRSITPGVGFSRTPPPPSPSPGNGFRPFQPNNNFNDYGVPRPSPSAPPGPVPYRNFARPSPAPYGNTNGGERYFPNERSGTAPPGPPNDPSMYNNNRF